ncbi:MAG TPA: rod shape-determining protein MreC [Acidimicrobiia bacterium]|nr:rod shape-determining protein MreC [Acidimicrobiia bacterium]
MVAYQRANRRPVLVLLVVTAVALITLDVRGSGPISVARGGAHDVVDPIARVFDAVLSPVGDWIDGITSATSLKDENARLRRRLDAARGQQASARAAVEENKELKKLLDLPFVDGANAVAAPVVDGAPGNFEHTVQIGKGAGDGVGVDMPVVTGAGLVGRVIQVSRDRATVLLVSDPQSGVGVKFGKTGTGGVAKGRGDTSTLRVDFVDPDVEVTKGEVVASAGLENSPFPAGIPVGTVSKVTRALGDLQQDVLVRPLVDFSHLDYVKVLRPAPGGP